MNYDKLDKFNTHRRILSLDPGESTGWVYFEVDDAPNSNDPPYMTGGTAGKNHLEVAELFSIYNPNEVVIESFHLYPGLAKSLSWNSFYPCEVIGVCKYLCMQKDIQWVEQAPSIKKFAGALNDLWITFQKRVKTTEHTKDAYLHLQYYLRNHKPD